MHVTFIYPDLFDLIPEYPGHYYVGIGHLSSYVRSKGHTTSLIHIVRRPTGRSLLIDAVKAHAPGLIAFSATTLQFGVVETVARWIKEEWPELPTICGGVHPTLQPEETLAHPGIDMVCVGEGEQPLATLCERISQHQGIRDIQNIWVKEGDTLHRNRISLPERSLDILPFPDRSIFNYPSLWWERNGTATIMASRGCPYRCNYCCNEALRNVYAEKVPAFRLRSVDNVIEEILRVRETYPFVTSLNFDDDIFFLNKKWAYEFTSEYASRVGLPFFCNIRPNIVSREIVALMKKAHCREVRIGLESGDDRIRNSVLNRSLSRQDIVNACMLLKEAGIYVRTFNILGIPGETPKEVLETIKINAEMGIGFPQYTVFYPFPGTQLYSLCEEQKLIADKEMTDYYSDTVLNLPSLSREHLQMFRTYFLRILQLYRLVMRLPSPARTPLTAIADTFFASKYAPFTMKILHKVQKMTRVLDRVPMSVKRGSMQRRTEQDR